MKLEGFMKKTLAMSATDLCGVCRKRCLTAGLCLCEETARSVLPSCSLNKFLSEHTVMLQYNSFESKGVNIQHLHRILHKNVLTDYILLLHVWLKTHKGWAVLWYPTTDWYVTEILFSHFAILTVVNTQRAVQIILKSDHHNNSYLLPSTFLQLISKIC